MSLKIIQRIDEKNIIQFYISNWRPPLVSPKPYVLLENKEHSIIKIFSACVV